MYRKIIKPRFNEIQSTNSSTDATELNHHTKSTQKKHNLQSRGQEHELDTKIINWIGKAEYYRREFDTKKKLKEARGVAYDKVADYTHRD